MPSLDINKTLVEGTDSKGGYSVPEQFARKIYELVQEKSIMLKFFERVNMTSDTWKAPTLVSGTTVRYPGEAGTITASDVTFGQVTLNAVKLATLTKMSTELMEDSVVDVMNMVADQMAQDIALAIDENVINGTYIFSTTCLSAKAGNTVSSTESNGDDISLDKFTSAKKEGWTDHFDYDVVVCNPAIIKKLMDLTDGNNRPIFNMETFGSPLLKEGAIGTVYGMKVYTTSSVPANLTKGTSNTLTDVYVMKSKKCGIFGLRRGLKVHKFYDIDDDTWKLQSNLRVAFNTAYPNAICKIEYIKTA